MIQLVRVPDCTFACFVERENWATGIHRQFFNLEPTVVDFTGLWNRERIIKVRLVTTSPKEVAKAKSFRLRFNHSLRFSVARSPAYSGVEFINVIAPEVSKGKALAALASHLGISMAEAMAIGDGTNDIPPFPQSVWRWLWITPPMRLRQ